MMSVGFWAARLGITAKVSALAAAAALNNVIAISKFLFTVYSSTPVTMNGPIACGPLTSVLGDTEVRCTEPSIKISFCAIAVVDAAITATTKPNPRLSRNRYTTPDKPSLVQIDTTETSISYVENV